MKNVKSDFKGEDQGSFTIPQSQRAILDGDFDHTAEFFSVRQNKRIPIVGILDALDGTVPLLKQIRQMKEAGVKRLNPGAGRSRFGA